LKNSSDLFNYHVKKMVGFKCSFWYLKLVVEGRFLLAELIAHHFRSVYGLLSTTNHVCQAQLGFLCDYYFYSFA
jgi:hypothetical protein